MTSTQPAPRRSRRSPAPRRSRRSPAPHRLDVLANEIKTEVEAAERDFRSFVQHAIAAGERLIEAKSLVHHGGWLSWLEENFPLGEREAQNYMRLARNPQLVADLPTLREAIARIAGPPELESIEGEAESIGFEATVTGGETPPEPAEESQPENEEAGGDVLPFPDRAKHADDLPDTEPEEAATEADDDDDLGLPPPEALRATRYVKNACWNVLKGLKDEDLLLDEVRDVLVELRAAIDEKLPEPGSTISA
jgi:hypothetical protein